MRWHKEKAIWQKGMMWSKKRGTAHTGYQRISKFQKMMKVYAVKKNELQIIDSLGCRLYIFHK